MPWRTGNDELFEALRQWVATNCPGRTVQRLRLYLDGDDNGEVRLLVPPALSRGEEETDDGGEDEAVPAKPAVSPLAAAILEALEEGPLGSKAIAARAGYPWDSRLRTCLTDLQRRGLVEPLAGNLYQLRRPAGATS